MWSVKYDTREHADSVISGGVQSVNRTRRSAEQRTVQGRETESEPVGSRTNTVERGVCRLDEVY